ncbi:MAG: XRE family transcriptional regulator [Sulfuricella sp.]|nr:XRE family transcriptional regulator [Sulfuricella sp.]
MIFNELQYKVSVSQIGKLRKSLETLKETGEPSWLVEAQFNALQSQISDLESEVIEFELLKRGHTKFTECSDLSMLPRVLIQSRIAKGMSQKDLAEALDMTAQQIQRYEATNYMGASLSRLIQIANILGVSIRGVWGGSESSAGNSIFVWKDSSSVDWEKFPLKEMISKGWLNLSNQVSPIQAAKNFFEQFAGPQYASALHRKKFYGENLPNEYSLLAWQARVLQKAKVEIKKGHVADDFEYNDRWISELIHLSIAPEAPAKVRDFLAQKGILLIIEEHLKGTYLDGAAMLAESGHPVVALTLRHDRLDNFWFVLLHELGHVFLHLFDSLNMDFFDEENNSQEDEIEKDADQFALNHLISPDAWELCLSRFSISKESVEADAHNLGIHPSIVAGRIRKEQNKYTILHEMIGQGEVRNTLGGE